jgi:hypothetical protein
MMDESYKTWRKRLDELLMQMEIGELTQDDVLKTERTDCLSVLVDLRGTRQGWRWMRRSTLIG